MGLSLARSELRSKTPSELTLGFAELAASSGCEEENGKRCVAGVLTPRAPGQGRRQGRPDRRARPLRTPTSCAPNAHA
eukprot:scaffold246643_cov31-Tisochrysis_lutea.AAC.1